MVEFVATPDLFFKSGMAMIIKHKALVSCRETTEQERIFKQNFGVSPLVLAQCWKLLMSHCDELKTFRARQKRLSPCHLLWACFFLKTYSKQSLNSSIAETSDKTFRKWAWIVIKLISDLEPYVVSDNN
jgi:hypothetical protein